MTRAAIFSIVSFGLTSIVWMYPYQSNAQAPTGSVKNNATSYNFEDDRIKVVVQECARKLQVLTCQATLTSKNSDRTVELNGSTIKLVDFEGNEYYPISVRLANKTSEQNAIKTELVENVPFKATFNFGKVPTNFDRVALLQIPLPLGGMTTIAKFRNFAIASSVSSPSPSPSANTNSSSPIAVSAPKTNTRSTVATLDPDVSSDNSAICPEGTKILYRATSKSYLLYICGGKNPTHYVSFAKDGSQGITLRLRYYDRNRFSADNGETNYNIATDRLTIRKDNKIIYQEKIQVLQALSTPISVEEAPKSKLKKNSPPASNNSTQKRSSTSQNTPTTKR